MSSQIASENSDPVIREPKRRRGHARVAALVAAASEVFAEKGFDGATMTEIAARAGASIGSLYQFFPTKDLIANAVQADGSEALSLMLDGMRDKAGGMDAAQLADYLFERITLALEAHPAFVALTDGRAEAPHKKEMRLRMRAQIAGLFGQVTPPLPPGKPEIMAVIVLQLMKAAVIFMREPDAHFRKQVLEEVRAMLRHHLAPQSPSRD